MTRSDIRTLPIRPSVSLLARLVDAWTRAFTRHRDRQLLSRLDPHLLRDIGLTPEEAQTECTKRFWQA